MNTLRAELVTDRLGPRIHQVFGEGCSHSNGGRKHRNKIYTARTRGAVMYTQPRKSNLFNGANVTHTETVAKPSSCHDFNHIIHTQLRQRVARTLHRFSPHPTSRGVGTVKVRWAVREFITTSKRCMMDLGKPLRRVWHFMTVGIVTANPSCLGITNYAYHPNQKLEPMHGGIDSRRLSIHWHFFTLVLFARGNPAR